MLAETLESTVIKKNVLVIFGTRPEAIKMCPVIQALESCESFRVTVCVTGQHLKLLQQVLDVFHVIPDYSLSIMTDNQTLTYITISILEKLKPVLEQEAPDFVLVHGDTTTTFATSLACYYMNIPVGHIEAGLRTYNTQSPYPEEFNRQAVGIIADYHFSPTELAQQNLLKEGKESSKIFVTGNTVIDALQSTIREDYEHPDLKWAENSRLILLTAHRRENLGEPLRNIFNAINKITETYDDVKIIYPVHPNPKVRSTAYNVFKNNQKVKLIEPLDVLDFHNFMKHSYMILTDSGGVQEEAPSLGKPLLVLRDVTERPEGVEAGVSLLVGTDYKKIYLECCNLLDNVNTYNKMSKKKNPYGDGTASKQIVEIIKTVL